jgi:hypothetical protein
MNRFDGPAVLVLLNHILLKFVKTIYQKKKKKFVKATEFANQILFNNFVISVDNGTQFAEASKRSNLVPLCRTIFSDQLTPVLAYRCLVKEDDRDAPSFLFESVEPHPIVSSVVSVLFLVLNF